MGNNYCCAYQDKPAEDITIESKPTLPPNRAENNINIALKLYQSQQRNSVNTSLMTDNSEYQNVLPTPANLT